MQWPDDDAMRGPPNRPSFGRLLRLDSFTRNRYEAEHGVERAAHLRHTVIFGVMLYILHDITTFLLLPDEYTVIIFATALVIFPSALIVANTVAKVRSETRELMVLLVMVPVTALPLYVFGYSSAIHSSHMNVEVILCIVFANMVMALRFRYALMYTTATLVLANSAVLLKQGLDPELQFALCIQFTSACILSVYSNYLFERRRCVDYCVSLEATLRAETAETSEKQFQEMSKTDALTGLPNRRFLDGKLDEWCIDTRPAVVMMIDIDHFKLFNDTLGHPAGDDCLRTIAGAFRGVFEEPDLFCARFGGEEFTLALRGAEEMQARRLAHAVVRSIETLRIPHPGRRDGIDIVTVSVGVALKPKEMMISRQTVLQQADEALYQAKRRGRNCFVINLDIPVGAVSATS